VVDLFAGRFRPGSVALGAVPIAPAPSPRGSGRPDRSLSPFGRIRTACCRAVSTAMLVDDASSTRRPVRASPPAADRCGSVSGGVRRTRRTTGCPAPLVGPWPAPRRSVATRWSGRAATSLAAAPRVRCPFEIGSNCQGSTRPGMTYQPGPRSGRCCTATMRRVAEPWWVVFERTSSTRVVAMSVHPAARSIDYPLSSTERLAYEGSGGRNGLRWPMRRCLYDRSAGIRQACPASGSTRGRPFGGGVVRLIDEIEPISRRLGVRRVGPASAGTCSKIAPLTDVALYYPVCALPSPG
jgi:hypothetical protein